MYEGDRAGRLGATHERHLSPSITLPLLRTQSDARLLELARGGHERAFEALVQRYRKPLLAYCRRLLLPEARAEDALQQALMRAWIAISAGSEVRDAKAWLYRIVHNTAVSALRRSGYDYVELDESLHGADAPEADLERRIAVRETLAGIAALPEAQRDVLLRTAVGGESHEQVAATLGLSDGAVRGLVYRARATLRAGLTAVTPPQLVLWAARAAESAPHLQTAEVAGGAGSAGMLGLLLKGGAAVVSAGVLATGTGLVGHGTSSVTPASASPGVRPAHGATAKRDSAALGARFGAGEVGAVLPVLVAQDGRGARGSGHRSGRDDRGRRGSSENGWGDGGAGGERSREGSRTSGDRSGAGSGSGSSGSESDGGASGGDGGGTSTSGPGPSGSAAAPQVFSTGDGGSSGSDGGQTSTAPAAVEPIPATHTSGGGPGPSGGDSTSGSGGSTSGSKDGGGLTSTSGSPN
jgi:RNA polymerase sigma factor (sigma-70 family)